MIKGKISRAEKLMYIISVLHVLWALSRRVDVPFLRTVQKAYTNYELFCEWERRVFSEFEN